MSVVKITEYQINTIQVLDLWFLHELNKEVYLRGGAIIVDGVTFSPAAIKSAKVTFTRCYDPTTTSILFKIGNLIYTSRYRYNENYCGERILIQNMREIEAKKVY